MVIMEVDKRKGPDNPKECILLSGSKVYAPELLGALLVFQKGKTTIPT